MFVANPTPVAAFDGNVSTTVGGTESISNTASLISIASEFLLSCTTTLTRTLLEFIIGAVQVYGDALRFEAINIQLTPSSDE